MPWVYILRGSNGRHYIGSAVDLDLRLAQHRRGHTHTTKRLGEHLEVVARKQVSTLDEARSIERAFFEIIFEGTDDASINGDTTWREYEFVAKPGDPNRRPPFVAPYQPRIDWQIWFAAMASPAEYPWTLHFVWKLLHNEPGTLSLIARNPFPTAPPHYIRARLYRYRFSRPNESGWWQREYIDEWLPALSADNESFRQVLAGMNWLD